MASTRRFGWVLVLAAALACARGASAPGPAAPGADGPAVYRGDLTVRMLLTGELRAEDAVPLVAPNVNVWPLQVRWLVEDGVEVEAGDRVVEFDNSQLVSNLEEMRVRAIEAATRLTSLRAQAASDEAQAVFELEQGRGNLQKARLEAAAAELKAPIERERRLLDLRRAELELEEAEYRLDSTRRAQRAEIEIQRIALENARTAVARAEEGIDKLTLRAARDGILIFEENRREGRAYQVGDSVYPGQTVARLPDLATMIVEARLFDVDDGRIAPGMAVRATLDAFPGRVFSGRVREIDRIAKDSGRFSLRRFFRTTIELDQVDPERMRPGMSVKVEIESTHRDLLLARRDALDWTADGARARLADGSFAPVALDLCTIEACAVDDGSLPARAAAMPVAAADRPPAAAEAAAPPTASPPAPTGPASTAPTPAEAVGQSVRSWAAAWSDQRVDDYLASYAETYSPPGIGRDRWRVERRARLRAPARIEVRVSGLEIEGLAAGRAVARFHQDYVTESRHLVADKVLELELRPEGWKIVREEAEPCRCGEGS